MTGKANKEAGLRPLGRLGQYMNFWAIHDDPPVIVTMDHRAAIVAGWAAAREGCFEGKTPNLFRLDAHPDMGEKPRPWAWEKAQLTNLDNVHAIVNDQRHDDGGWVISAMQFGLVRHVVTCFLHEYHRFPGDCGMYEDHMGNKHELLSYCSVRELQKHSEKNYQAQDVCEELMKQPIWVDIDLDFATKRNAQDEVSLWDDQDWAGAFDGEALQFVSGLLDRASLITISTEPEFCGGLEAVGKISTKWKEMFGGKSGMFEKL